MKNYLILSCFFFFLTYCAIGQNIKWSVSINAGLSDVPFTYTPGEDEVRNYEEEWNSTYSFCWSYGTNFEVPLYQFLSLESGINFNIIRGKNIQNLSFTFLDFSTFNYEVTNKMKSTYFGLPLFLKINMDKFNIHLGGRLFYFTKGTNTNNVIFTDDMGSFEEQSKETISIELRDFDYGLGTGLSFKLTKRIHVRSDLYWGMRNLLKQNRASNPLTGGSSDQRNRRLSFGLSYYL